MQKSAAKNQAAKTFMRTKIVSQIIKYFSLLAVFACSILLSAIVAGAQTKNKRPPVAAKFSVPCAEALNIGLDALEKKHSKKILLKNGGKSDSGTEFTAEKNALENYLGCRRADTAAKLKKLPADQRATINQTANRARKLARMRVNLIYGVSFNERDEDQINFGISQNAVALVEDYKGMLTNVYLETRDYGAYSNTEAAGRDIEKIGTLLKRIEKISLDSDQAAEFRDFKNEVEKALAEIADEVGSEKHVTTDFLVRLLEMNLPDEN